MRKYLEKNEHKPEPKSRKQQVSKSSDLSINQAAVPVQKIKLLPKHVSQTNANKIINYVLANKGKIPIFLFYKYKVE